MSLRAFTTSIAPSSEGSSEWLVEAIVDRDVPAGSSIQITGQMSDVIGYRWIETQGAIVTMAGRKKQKA
jgi:hypothetical protein